MDLSGLIRMDIILVDKSMPALDGIVFHPVGLLSLNPKFLISHLGWNCICVGIGIVWLLRDHALIRDSDPPWSR